MQPTSITITVADLVLTAELNESATAKQIASALPIEGIANTWGDEIYCWIPVTTAQAPDAQQEVDVGVLAYWPAGSAFCIFFGPTPMSSDDQPRAFSPVNIVGRVVGDPTVLRNVQNGAQLRIEATGESAGPPIEPTAANISETLV
jgi:uncharacterized protein